jgi:hypothetical protein
MWSRVATLPYGRVSARVGSSTVQYRLPIVPRYPAGFGAAGVEDAAVEMSVAEGTHLAFDAGDVLTAEVDEENVAGEEGGVSVVHG